MYIDIIHARTQHHQRVSEVPPVTIHVNSNKDISTEGIDIIRIDNTNPIRCSIGILLLENNIATHSIPIVVNNAIPAYLDCSEPKKMSFILIAVLGIFLFIFYYHMKKNKK